MLLRQVQEVRKDIERLIDKDPFFDEDASEPLVTRQDAERVAGKLTDELTGACRSRI